MTDQKVDNDALERLKNKNRPTVDSRDASLTSTHLNVSESESVDTRTSGMLDNEVSQNLDTQESSILEVNISSETSPKTQRASKRELETKQSTLRLEAKLSKRLQSLCQKQGVCREVLIEAMFEYCEGSPEILSAILAEAREKNEFRQQIANRRRAKAMMDKFGN